MKTTKALRLGLAVIFLVSSLLAKVPQPEEFLSFKVGADRKLADMHQIIEYFRLLDGTKGRVKVEEVGLTTMGNPFLVAVISSPENQKNLEKYQHYQQLLADPRRITDKEAAKIIKEGKTVVMINCSIHASEIGASQMSMKLAYELATSEDRKIREILNNVILLLVPMHNPDGIQMVVDWYKKNLGTKYEGGRMPWLYNKYVGHDNNRDWYMLTQVESRLTIKVHNAWHPQIVLDMHQMGSRGPRMFVPPYVDPFESNIDHILEQEVAMMGTFIAAELTAEGKAGVIHSTIFDAWTPARAYHHYHGGIRILTEVASVKIATPIEVKFEELPEALRKSSVKMPLPWKGGKWRLKDIIDYDYTAAMAVLTNAARLRECWLQNFYRIHQKAVSRKKPPYAFLIPSEQDNIVGVFKMMKVLRLGGVEIQRAEEPFMADGCQYPAGTFIIYLAQPYGGYAKVLLERQRYPEIREYPGGPLKRPYDVVAHNIALLMGVEVRKIERPFKVDSELLTKIEKPLGRVEEVNHPFGYLWRYDSNDDMVALNRLVKKGYRVFWAAEELEIAGQQYPAGTMIVVNKEGLKDELKSLSHNLAVVFKGIKTRPPIKAYQLKPLRLGLYRSWTASMDEGWTRWVLEQYEFPYQSVFDKDIRKGNLRADFDVLILPDMSQKSIIEGISEKEIPPQYAGGIGQVGVENLKQFVQDGGALITLNGAAELTLKQFYLSIENRVEKLDRKNFYIPGSILKVLINNNHPIAYGYGREGAVMFRRSPVFSPKEGQSVIRYPLHNPLLSGWVSGEEYLHDKSALVDVPYGQGRIILIGFPAQYRGQAQATFRFLFNSIYYGVAKLGKF